jgi:hypothetical protein
MKVTQSDHDKKIEMQEERVKRIQAKPGSTIDSDCGLNPPPMILTRKGGAFCEVVSFISVGPDDKLGPRMSGALRLPPAKRHRPQNIAVALHDTDGTPREGKPLLDLSSWAAG